MYLVQLHMLRRLLVGSLAITAVLSGVGLFINPEGIFQLLVSGALPFGQFLLANLFELPIILCHTCPIGVAIATGWFYRQWSADCHIVTLRNMGLSNIGIALPGILCGIIAAGWTAAVTLYLLPVGCQHFYEIMYVSINNTPYTLLHDGYLNSVAPDLSIKFREWLASDTIGDVTIIDTRNGDFALITAEAGTFVPSRAGDVLQLHNGIFQRKSQGREAANPIAFDSMTVPLDRKQVDVSSRPRGSFERNIGDLLDPPASIRLNAIDADHWIAEGHRRLLMPLLCINYVLLCLGVLCWRQPARLGLALRAVGLTLAVTVIHLLLVVMHAVFARHLDLVALLYAIALVPGAAGLALLLANDRPFVRRRRTPRRRFGWARQTS